MFKLDLEKAEEPEIKLPTSAGSQRKQENARKFGNSAVATGLERSVFIPVPKKGNAKECSNYCTVALISHASKVMLKILQARFLGM